MRNVISVHMTKFLQLLGCCIFFMLITDLSCAQTRGTVEVIRDPRIDTLIARRLTTGSGRTTGFSSNGYRVQIFTGSNRTEAFKAQTKFQDNYPDVPTYISYREPNFKVRVGDYRTRMEATKMMQNLRLYFPLMFVINEKINPPKLTIDN